MHIEELSPLPGGVSWTGKPFNYFVHTIDRSLVSKFSTRSQLILAVILSCLVVLTIKTNMMMCRLILSMASTISGVLRQMFLYFIEIAADLCARLRDGRITMCIDCGCTYYHH